MKVNRFFSFLFLSATQMKGHCLQPGMQKSHPEQAEDVIFYLPGKRGREIQPCEVITGDFRTQVSSATCLSMKAATSARGMRLPMPLPT
jgi:hypothetical protein